MIFSPFLNIFIHKCPKTLYWKFVFIFVILAVFIAGTIPGGLSLMSGNLIWFIGLYLLTGYIKKHVNITKINKKKNLLLFFVSFGLLALISIVLNLLGFFLKSNTVLDNTDFFNSSNSIFIFVASLELFLFAIKSRPRENKFVNLVASSTLGIYLIHENLFLRPFLWQTVFHTLEHSGSHLIVPYALFSTTLVFSVSCGIDLIRQNLIEKPLLPIIFHFYDWAYLKIMPVYNRVKIRLEKL